MSSKFSVLREIATDVYLIHTNFWFYNLFPVSNNGVVVRIHDEQSDQDQGNHFLVAINAPEMTSDLYNDLKSLNLPIKYIIGSDWHHLFVDKWIEKFPTARAVFPGYRAFDKHPPGTFKDDVIILDRDQPKLPDDAKDISLIPWTGFLQPIGQSTRVEDNGFRSEVSVYHRPSKLLFVFDPFICTSNSLPGIFGWGFSKMLGSIYDTKTDPQQTNPLPYKRNFGPGTGFRIGDEAKAHQSAVRLCELDIDHLVTSHGIPEKGALTQANPIEAKRILEVCLDPLLKLTPPTSTGAT